MNANEGYQVTYGTRAAVAHSEDWNGSRNRYFTIMLDKDPGFGSMTFTHIPRSQVKFIGEEPPAAQLKGSDGVWRTEAEWRRLWAQV